MKFLPKRVRIFFWLLSGFLRRHFVFLVIGSLLGTLAFFWSKSLVKYLPEVERGEKVGLVGKFDINEVPYEIQKLVSRGLTRVKKGGLWEGDLAKSWEINEGGKVYVFHLKDDIYWHDEKKFVCRDINYNFSDVEISCRDDKTVEFRLKDPFVAFPVALSRPLFKKGLVGLSGFKVKEVKTNGPLIESILLEEIAGGFSKKKILFRFYPTTEHLKTAFSLGKINKIEEVKSTFGLGSERGIKINSRVRDDKYSGLFFDTSRGLVGDKDFRQALCYATKKEGQTRAISPISPLSWAFNENVKLYEFNLKRARELLGKLKLEKQETLVIGTVPEYLSLAEEIKTGWEAVSDKIKVEIKIVSGIEEEYDVLLIERNIPSDPDQYIYWHSTQEQTNVTNFKDPRIDKLLEDGRKILDEEERKKIYFDFQRYLLEDVPVCFLFHPTYYTIERK